MNNSDNILVVDDDPRMRELLRASLEAEMFQVVEADSSKALYQTLETSEIDLITLDVMLDHENGLDLVRDIRKLSQVPIILVTGRSDLIDTVVGLELGADDYITKPFLVRELIARIRSVLRRSRTAPNSVEDANDSPSVESSEAGSAERSLELIRFGGWSINTAARELRNINNAIVSLTTTEYDLLDIFVSKPQRVLSREYLMERLTGREWHPSDRVIDNHVAQLRKKLEHSDSSEWIKTVRGAGYMFTGKIQRENLPD